VIGSLLSSRSLCKETRRYSIAIELSENQYFQNWAFTFSNPIYWQRHFITFTSLLHLLYFHKNQSSHTHTHTHSTTSVHLSIIDRVATLYKNEESTTTTTYVFLRIAAGQANAPTPPRLLSPFYAHHPKAVLFHSISQDSSTKSLYSKLNISYKDPYGKLEEFHKQPK